jgi:hypothetical protein
MKAKKFWGSFWLPVARYGRYLVIFSFEIWQIRAICFLKNHLYVFKSYFSGLKKKLKSHPPPPPPPPNYKLWTLFYLCKESPKGDTLKKRVLLSRISFFDTKISQNPQIFFLGVRRGVLLQVLSTGYWCNGPLQTCRQLRRNRFWNAHHWMLTTRVFFFQIPHVGTLATILRH